MALGGAELGQRHEAVIVGADIVWHQSETETDAIAPRGAFLIRRVYGGFDRSDVLRRRRVNQTDRRRAGECRSRHHREGARAEHPLEAAFQFDDHASSPSVFKLFVDRGP